MVNVKLPAFGQCVNLWVPHVDWHQLYGPARFERIEDLRIISAFQAAGSVIFSVFCVNGYAPKNYHDNGKSTI